MSKLLRKISILAVGCVLSLAFPACSLRLNDKVKKTEHSVSVGGGCLSQAGDVFERFYKGSLSEAEHESFYDCTNKALTTFLTYAEGNNRDTFEPAELGNFLTKYFLQGKVIQPALLAEVMALKSSLVGGSPDRLSREDLRRVLTVIARFRETTRVVRPLMPISASSFLARGYGAEEFETAIRTFVGAINRFGNEVSASQGPYDLARFGALVQEIQTYLYPEAVPLKHWTMKALHFSTVLPAAKAIFISPPRDQITPADWPKVYRLAPRYFASLLRLQYYWKAPYVTVYGGGLRGIERVFQDFLNTFDFLLEQHPGERISSDEIEDLVRALAAEKILPCQPETARQFVQVLFGKVLGASSGAGPFAVTKESVSRLRTNLRYLLEGFHAVEALYRAKFGDAFFDGVLSREEIAAVPSETLFQATSLKSELSLEAVEAVKNTPRDVRTVFSGTGINVVIPEHGTPLQYSYSHMITVQGMRAVNRLLLEAYGGQGSRALSPSQVQAIVGDLFPILMEAGLFDKSLQNSVSTRLFEASLFLYSSDGDNGLTMNEALEMESLVLSTLTNATRSHALLSTACDEGKGFVNTKPPVAAACYRRTFIRKAAEIWNFLPGLAKHYASLSSEARYELFDLMGSFLRKGKPERAEYTLGDTQAFTLMPYYVEMLFSRFDRNGDGEIDNAEAARAYPIFRPFLARKAAEKGLNDPKDHEAIFNFILAYRELPTDDQWHYAARRYLFGPKRFHVNRGQVIEIFAKLLSL